MEINLNVKFSAAPDLLEALALLASKSPRLDQLDRMIEGAHDRIGNLSAALALQGLKTYPTDDRESYPVPELNAATLRAAEAYATGEIPKHENFAERERRVTRPDLTENGAPVPNIKPAVPPGYLPAENRTAEQAAEPPLVDAAGKPLAPQPDDQVAGYLELPNGERWPIKDGAAQAETPAPAQPETPPAATQPAAERQRTPSGRLSRAKTPEQKQQALAEKHAAKKAENGQNGTAPRGLYETTGDEDDAEPDTSGEPGTGNDGRPLAELLPPVDPAATKAPVNGSAPAPIAKGLPTGELSVEDVRRVTQDAVFRNAANRDVIREMLNEIGVERASDLDPKEWTAYVQKVVAL